jgi:hypothetical protein
VRKAGDRVRITAQLVETETGAHVWADRYDGVVEKIFDLQDEIKTSVVGAIEPQLRKAELSRAKRQRPRDPTAYDCCCAEWRGTTPNPARKMTQRCASCDTRSKAIPSSPHLICRVHAGRSRSTGVRRLLVLRAGLGSQVDSVAATEVRPRVPHKAPVWKVRPAPPGCAPGIAPTRRSRSAPLPSRSVPPGASERRRLALASAAGNARPWCNLQDTGRRGRHS